MMQPSNATAQSFQVPNHSRFGVPWTSQTMSQIKLAKHYLLDSAHPQRAQNGRLGESELVKTLLASVSIVPAVAVYDNCPPRPRSRPLASGPVVAMRMTD